MAEKWVIESPNDWIVKAGGYVKDGKLYQPHEFIIIPMTIASQEIVKFRSSTNLLDRTRHALTIALTVRIADTSFYINVAKYINNVNPGKKNICQHCLRGQMFGTRMKELRKSVNNKIIHEMEEGKIMLNPDDLPLADEYYEEMFKLPLMDPISIPETKNLILCDRCKKKWGYA